MPNPQHAILTDLAKYQWYTHFSRTEGAGNALTENEAKRTGRPSTWLAACAI